MNSTTTTITKQNQPGQGISRKARLRRRNRQEAIAAARNITARKQSPSSTTTIITRKQGPKRSRARRGQSAFIGGWTGSLINPCHKGARIPDPFTLIPTGVFQVQADLTFTVNAGNVAGFTIDPYACCYLGLGADATAATLTWDGTAGYDPKSLDGAGRSFLDNYCAQWRVVSACADVYYAGTTNNDGGIAYGFSAPGVQIGKTNVVNYTTRNLPIQAHSVDLYPSAEQYPVRNGMRINWLPNGAVPTVTFTTAKITDGFKDNNYCYFGYMAEGAYTGMILATKITVNYEFIAKTDSMNIIPMERPAMKTASIDWERAWSYLNNGVSKITPLFGGWSGAMNAAAQYTGARLFNNPNLLRIANN